MYFPLEMVMFLLNMVIFLLKMMIFLLEVVILFHCYVSFSGNPQVEVASLDPGAEMPPGFFVPLGGQKSHES